MISFWFVKGAHKLTFAEWMELDMEDIRLKSFWYDAGIVLKTIGVMTINVVYLVFTGIDKPRPNNCHFTKGHK